MQQGVGEGEAPHAAALGQGDLPWAADQAVGGPVAAALGTPLVSEGTMTPTICVRVEASALAR